MVHIPIYAAALLKPLDINSMFSNSIYGLQSITRKFAVKCEKEEEK